MQKVEIFRNSDYEIRTTTVNNEPYFMLNDACNILEINNPSQAKTRLKIDGVITNEVIDNLGRKQQATFINESNLYKLVFQSRKSEAERFTDWVTSDVIPSIRKHGTYMTDSVIEKTLTDPDYLIQLATTIKEERAKRQLAEAENQKNKPKVLFADSVEASSDSILIGELAKLICQNGFSIGQNRLFDWLRNNNYLIKRGERRNQPTQYSMDLGLMDIKKRTIDNPDGSIRTTVTTKITGKGQIYFINKFLGGNNWEYNQRKKQKNNQSIKKKN